MADSLKEATLEVTYISFLWLFCDRPRSIGSKWELKAFWGGGHIKYQDVAACCDVECLAQLNDCF
jgi:hypothetical protein